MEKLPLAKAAALSGEWSLPGPAEDSWAGMNEGDLSRVLLSCLERVECSCINYRQEFRVPWRSGEKREEVGQQKRSQTHSVNPVL